MTDEKNLNRCQYVCPRKQRQCRMSPSTHLSTYCMEHLLYDPNLDEVFSIFQLNKAKKTNFFFRQLNNLYVFHVH